MKANAEPGRPAKRLDPTPARHLFPCVIPFSTPKAAQKHQVPPSRSRPAAGRRACLQMKCNILTAQVTSFTAFEHVYFSSPKTPERMFNFLPALKLWAPSGSVTGALQPATRSSHLTAGCCYQLVATTTDVHSPISTPTTTTGYISV